ncbi:hypothetical protein K9S39_23565 [Streptomyces halobius]|uniref:Uncharacterized protein n=1 Tax=Streptomyces halobius TaxID=2879846 RepID=A0ABY4MDK2_9ACTN|nr:hypothetical protein K9S39_23565 [Streptomyces halobius]
MAVAFAGRAEREGFAVFWIRWVTRLVWPNT